MLFQENMHIRHLSKNSVDLLFKKKRFVFFKFLSNLPLTVFEDKQAERNAAEVCSVLRHFFLFLNRKGPPEAFLSCFICQSGTRGHFVFLFCFFHFLFASEDFLQNPLTAFEFEFSHVRHTPSLFLTWATWSCSERRTPGRKSDAGNGAEICWILKNETLGPAQPVWKEKYSRINKNQQTQAGKTQVGVTFFPPRF